MVEALPLSIALSAQQKEALEVITEELGSLQDPDWPPRVILLWSDGISQSDAAIKLGIGEEAVERVRRRWLSGSARIGAAEAKVGKAFRTFFSLVCDTLSQESPTDTAPCSRAGVTKTGTTNQEQLIENTELRGATRALIEIIHHPTKFEGLEHI